MRTTLYWLVATIVAASQPAQAANVDPRALEACKAQSTGFVEIANCLPDADVAIKVLDAFDKIYTPQAAPLKAKCIELNKDDIAAAETCVRTAIQSAVELKASLPEGSSLDDPVFQAVANETLAAELEAARQDARNNFPDKMMWGGAIYHPYK